MRSGYRLPKNPIGPVYDSAVAHRMSGEVENMSSSQVNDIIELMETVIGDSSIPKNIRKNISDARDRLRANEDLAAKVSSAIYSIEEISEDINMPMHARTQIWTIMSALESMKK